jgi:hypothetical protein
MAFKKWISCTTNTSNCSNVATTIYFLCNLSAPPLCNFNKLFQGKFSIINFIMAFKKRISCTTNTLNWVFNSEIHNVCPTVKCHLTWKITIGHGNGKSDWKPSFERLMWIPLGWMLRIFAQKSLKNHVHTHVHNGHFSTILSHFCPIGPRSEDWAERGLLKTSNALISKASAG